MTRRHGTSCQLCEEGINHGKCAPAVATVARVRICEKHLTLLHLIAFESGTPLDPASVVLV